ncbi:MAG: Gldg family protein [Desulfobacterales bacterium]|nr:Gldg family protein [Desulfobacterales bacterium]
MSAKGKSETYIKLIIYVVVVVLVNLVGMTLFFRFDLTQNKIYSISAASKKVVSTLSEPLTINVFFTKNLPAPYNNIEQYLHDLLEEYAIHANRYFNYKFYDVSAEEEGAQSQGENQELAKSYGVYPVQIQNIEQDEIKFIKAYMGMVLIHGDLIEKVPTISTTDGLEYEITTAIQKLNNKISTLLNLKEKIQVILVMSSSLEIVAPYMSLKNLPELPKKVEEVVDKINKKNYSKLQYQYLDPSTDEAKKTEAQKYNIMTLKWPAIANANISEGSGMIGLVIAYGGKTIEVPLISVLRLPLIGTRYELVDMNDLESIINDNIESLIDINENIGYLADYGTLDARGASPMGFDQQQDMEKLSNFSGALSQNYSMKYVELKKDKIPDSINTLIIARPNEEFSDYDLFQIDQFLMRGKSLALFLDAFKEIQSPNQNPFGYSPPNYVQFDSGLEKLLNHYGIRIKKSYVLDENCYKQRLGQQFGGGERPIYFAPIIKPDRINEKLDYLRHIKGLITMKSSPLELDKDKIKENGISADLLFSSSERSWEMRDNINLNGAFMRPPAGDDQMQSMPLCYLLKGEFPSYFADKPIPEKKVEKEEKEGEQTDTEKSSTEAKPEEPKPVDLSQIDAKGSKISKGKPGKIFLLATSEVLKDNMLDKEAKTPNAVFIMNVLDALNNRNDIAEMRSKEQRFNPLAETTATAKTVIKSFNIGGLPVLIIGLGLIVMLVRHTKKKHIQIMFQK